MKLGETVTDVELSLCPVLKWLLKILITSEEVSKPKKKEFKLLGRFPAKFLLEGETLWLIDCYATC